MAHNLIASKQCGYPITALTAILSDLSAQTDSVKRLGDEKRKISKLFQKLIAVFGTTGIQFERLLLLNLPIALLASRFAPQLLVWCTVKRTVIRSLQYRNVTIFIHVGFFNLPLALVVHQEHSFKKYVRHHGTPIKAPFAIIWRLR